MLLKRKVNNTKLIIQNKNKMKKLKILCNILNVDNFIQIDTILISTYHGHGNIITKFCKSRIGEERSY